MDAMLHDFLRIPSWKAAPPVLAKYREQIGEFKYRIISAHHNEMTLDMLCEALKPIADAQPKPAPTIIKEKKPKRVPKAARAVYELPDVKEWPEDLVELRAQVIRWLREQQSLHGTIQHLAYDEPEGNETKMYRYCDRMVHIEEKLQDAYQRLDYYQKNGTYMPGTAPMNREDRLKYLLKHQPRDISYVRRFRDSTDEKVQKEIARRSARLEEIKKIVQDGKN